MDKINNDNYDISDILASLDDEEVEEEMSLEDFLATMDDEEEENEDLNILDILEDLDNQLEENEEKLNETGLSFNDYAKSLIADLENESNEDDVISALEDLDDEEDDEYKDLSIEELFKEFVDSVKKLSDDEKEILEEKVNKVASKLETSD